jgi:hypothetical protein
MIVGRREFSAFDGNSGSLKGKIKQNTKYSLVNARVEAGTIVTLRF